eukprot:837374-Amphidinium_carterae.1
MPQGAGNDHHMLQKSKADRSFFGSRRVQCSTELPPVRAYRCAGSLGPSTLESKHGVQQLRRNSWQRSQHCLLEAMTETTLHELVLSRISYDDLHSLVGGYGWQTVTPSNLLSLTSRPSCFARLPAMDGRT